MSPRGTALAVAIFLLAASDCFLIALFYAPLPQPWDLFLGLIVVLTGFFWITLLLGLALIVLLAVQALAGISPIETSSALLGR